MPKLVYSLPKYRRHKASGQAVVTLDGKDWYLGPHGTQVSRNEYDRLIKEWLANGRRLAVREDQSLSIDQLLAAFWQHAERYYVGLDGKPTSELDSYRQAMKLLRPLYGQKAVDSFGPLCLKAIREGMITSNGARKYINQQMGRIKRIFKWGVENELVSAGVFHALQAVAGLKRGRSAARETGPVKPAPRTIVEAVQPFVSRHVWAMIELQLLTGMRSGEVTTMRGRDLVMKGDVWEYRPSHHKTAYRGRDRIVYLGPKAQDIVRSFLKSNADEYLFSPTDADLERQAVRRASRRTPMTPSHAQRSRRLRPAKSPGSHYTSQSYGRAIADATKRAKVDRWSPHQLRHAAATQIREHFGLEAAQVILGHARADVTQVYAEANRRKAAEIMGKVG